MFNVTIINIKKTTKYIITLLVSLTVIYFAINGISKLKNSKIIQTSISEKLIQCLSREIPAIDSLNNVNTTQIKEDTEENANYNMAGRILGMELAKIQDKKTKIIDDEVKEKPIQEEVPKEETDVPENAETLTITKNPIAENSNTEINGVKIKNETSFEINEDIMKSQETVDKTTVTIFHTHTCESYTPSEKYPYEQTGNYRTTDLNYSVARVGDELEKFLKSYGVNVIHDKTYHDYPAYTGSYTRSKETVEKILQENKSDIIIDLHRDAIGGKSNYDPSVKIGEDEVAKLMFVIGTDGGGLYHPQWRANLQFAIKVQEKANEMYPGLFKPIIVRNSRYNQHLGKSACIIEVGATGNTLDQCLTSMKYLSKIISEI